jgi:pyruvate kinase
MRKAKIVCTIGPSSSSKSVMKSLTMAGMNIARLNFSHGSHETHQKAFETIRETARICDSPVAILQDLGGIKIRVGPLKGGSLLLKKGAVLKIVTEQIEGDDDTISVSYPHLVNDAAIGDRILLDDGFLQLAVAKKGKDHLLTTVVEGGVLKERKGVNLPGMDISASSLTKKDKEDLSFGVKMGVDYIAMSFVRSSKDVKEIKRWLKRNNAEIPVIAKIEKPQAVENIESILDVSDGLMIARGDLGVELSAEKVPLLQKALIEKANRGVKLVITATQMLESMTDHSRPTRAEAADVANAVLDGTDGLMLSAETALGEHPVEAVKMMSRIIQYTEVNRDKTTFVTPSVLTTHGAVVESACRAAEKVNAKALIAFTQSGSTALLASKFKPSVPIIAYTLREETLRKMSLFWGVTARLMRPLENTDEMVFEVEKALLKDGFAKNGDVIVIIASSPLSLRGKTNLMKIHRIER